MSQSTLYRRESPTRDYRSILLLLGVAAALPLLGAGVFAGTVLALMVAGWLVLAKDVPRPTVLWALTLLVLAENIVFLIGFLR